ALLASHAWPGNIRELRNVLERAVLLGEERRLSSAALRSAIGRLVPLPEQRPATSTPQAAVGNFHAARAAFERELIRQALAEQSGNVQQAAARLGLGRSTLYKKMLALGLSS